MKTKQEAVVKLESPKLHSLLMIYLIVISFLELLAYWKGGLFSFLASRVWLFTGLALFSIFIVSTIKSLYSDIQAKKIIPILGMILVVGMYTFCIGNISISDINPDSATQLADGLDSFNETDWNYTGTGFLDYPNRQYLINALPSHLFGRSIVTFHAGFALPYLVGIIMLFLELRSWLQRKDMPEEIALLPIGAFATFPFITEYYRNFEQAFTPVALTTIAVALYLRLIRTHDAVAVLSLSWVGGFFADSYTPGLASLGLLMLFLVLDAYGYWEKSHILIPDKTQSTSSNKITDIVLVLSLVAFFVATLLIKRGDRITEVREDYSIVREALASWSEFLTDQNVRFLGFWSGAVIIYLVFSLTLRLHVHNALIALWVLGVVFMSNYLVGYTTYEKSWIIQRSMIVIPVLITIVFFCALDFLSNNRITLQRTTIYILFVLFFAIGVFNFGQPHRSFTYFEYVEPMKYLISDVRTTLEENNLDESDRFSVVVYTDNALQTNIQDYARYFFPNASCYTYGTNEIGNTADYYDIEPVFYFSEVPFGIDGEEDVLSAGNNIAWYRHVG